MIRSLAAARVFSGVRVCTGTVAVGLGLPVETMRVLTGVGSSEGATGAASDLFPDAQPAAPPARSSTAAVATNRREILMPVESCATVSEPGARAVRFGSRGRSPHRSGQVRLPAGAG